MNLEQQVLDSIKEGLAEIIKTKLGGYKSPLDDVISKVFESEQAPLIAVLREVFQEVIGTQEFKQTIKEEFQRKVAKNLVGMLEGQVSKASNALKQDPTMKSRMILAIENIINESTQ